MLGVKRVKVSLEPLYANSRQTGYWTKWNSTQLDYRETTNLELKVLIHYLFMVVCFFKLPPLTQKAEKTKKSVWWLSRNVEHSYTKTLGGWPLWWALQFQFDTSNKCQVLAIFSDGDTNGVAQDSTCQRVSWRVQAEKTFFLTLSKLGIHTSVINTWNKDRENKKD